MREAIGSVALYNLIIAFIVIVFALLAGSVSYNKAFKVNSGIANAIEKFEGYNTLSSEEIDRFLNNIGYTQVTNRGCPNKNGVKAMNNLSKGNYQYCIYEFPGRKDYYSYGVITYMYLDIPVIGQFLRLPVYSKTDTYYRFHIEDLYPADIDGQYPDLEES